MTRRLLLPVVCCLLVGCDLTFSHSCLDVGLPTIVVTVRDDRGEPAAIGTTVVAETVFSKEPGVRLSEEGWEDPLRIALEGNGPAGEYRVTVSRPGHHTVVVDRVVVRAAECQPETGEVEVVLPRVEGAAPVRLPESSHAAQALDGDGAEHEQKER